MTCDRDFYAKLRRRVSSNYMFLPCALIYVFFNIAQIANNSISPMHLSMNLSIHLLFLHSEREHEV